jgi:hypothetical protein
MFRRSRSCQLLTYPVETEAGSFGYVRGTGSTPPAQSWRTASVSDRSAPTGGKSESGTRGTVDPRRVPGRAAQRFERAESPQGRRGLRGRRDEGRKLVVDPHRRRHGNRPRRLFRCIPATGTVAPGRMPGEWAAAISLAIGGLRRFRGAAGMRVQIVPATGPCRRSRRQSRGAHRQRGEETARSRPENGHRRRRWATAKEHVSATSYGWRPQTVGNGNQFTIRRREAGRQSGSEIRIAGLTAERRRPDLTAIRTGGRESARIKSSNHCQRRPECRSPADSRPC